MSYNHQLYITDPRSYIDLRVAVGGYGPSLPLHSSSLIPRPIEEPIHVSRPIGIHRIPGEGVANGQVKCIQVYTVKDDDGRIVRKERIVYNRI